MQKAGVWYVGLPEPADHGWEGIPGPYAVDQNPDFYAALMGLLECSQKAFAGCIVVENVG